MGTHRAPAVQTLYLFDPLMKLPLNRLTYFWQNADRVLAQATRTESRHNLTGSGYLIVALCWMARL